MFKIVSGPGMNLLGRGAPYGATGQYGPLCTDALDAAYPLVNAYDRRPSVPMKLAAVTTGMLVSFPNNLVPNGDFEQAISGWAAVSATLTSESDAGNLDKGAKSGKVVTSAPGGQMYRRDITVYAGEWLQLRASLKSDGSNVAYIDVLNLTTMQSLQSNGTWGAAAHAMSRTTATMAALTPITFQMPDVATLGGPTATLQVSVIGSAAQTFYVDELLIVPGFNFVGAFGHGFEASSGLAVTDSGANYWHSPSRTSNLVGTPANLALAKQSASALAGSMQYDPFPAVGFYPAAALGSVPTLRVPWVGEIVVGQALDLTRNPDYPVSVEYRQPNVRYQTAAGGQWVMPRGSNPLRKVTLSFAYHNDTEYSAARDALYTMSAGGAYPLILIPTETDAGEAIYGRLEDSTAFTRVGYGERRAEFVVQEEAGPWF